MSEKDSFWSTAPGLLTGIAAVITAIGGLLTVFYQVGVIGPREGSDNGPDVPPTAVLPAPVPKRPECGGAIPISADSDGIPFSWQPAEGASTYTVEVDCFGCSGYERNWYSLAAGRPWHIRTGLGLRSPIYSSRVDRLMREAGGYAIRWRVWGVDHEGRGGAKSDWCQCAFSGGRRPPPRLIPGASSQPDGAPTGR